MNLNEKIARRRQELSSNKYREPSIEPNLEESVRRRRQEIIEKNSQITELNQGIVTSHSDVKNATHQTIDTADRKQELAIRATLSSTSWSLGEHISMIVLVWISVAAFFLHWSVGVASLIFPTLYVRRVMNQREQKIRKVIHGLHEKPSTGDFPLNLNKKLD